MGIAVRECNSLGNIRRLAAVRHKVQTAVDAPAAHDEDAENAFALAALLAA